MGKTILMLSSPTDTHIFPVAEELVHRGEDVVLADVAEIPDRSMHVDLDAQSGWKGTLHLQNRFVDVERLKSIWWRRPGQWKAPEGVYTSDVATFLEREAYRGIVGLLSGLTLFDAGPLWVSRPDRIRATELKPMQLAAASALGLSVPRTLLTTEPEAVRHFWDMCQGRLICKTLARGIVGPPAGDDVRSWEERARYIYTNRVQADDLTPEHLEGVRTTVHFFQEEIEKALDIRVIIIGRQLFAIGIDAQGHETSRLDWRRGYQYLHYQKHVLPEALQQTLFQLVKYFDLQFSAIDLVLSPSGTYYYLEQNPNGQFLWRTPPVEYPLKEAMADLLSKLEEFAL